jgi:hypothetical protein
MSVRAVNTSSTEMKQRHTPGSLWTTPFTSGICVCVCVTIMSCIASSSAIEIRIGLVSGGGNLECPCLCTPARGLCTRPQVAARQSSCPVLRAHQILFDCVGPGVINNNICMQVTAMNHVVGTRTIIGSDTVAAYLTAVGNSLSLGFPIVL